MPSSTNDKEVFTTVHDDVVAAAVDSTTVDSDNSGGVSGPVVPETKGNDDDADAMVDHKNKSSADNVSEKGVSSKIGMNHNSFWNFDREVEICLAHGDQENIL
jgi:hypothetical protein